MLSAEPCKSTLFSSGVAVTAGFHFIASLPRSGSTLLGALLRQNLAFHAGMTSPVGSLVGASVELMSARREAAHLVTTEQKRSKRRERPTAIDVYRLPA